MNDEIDFDWLNKIEKTEELYKYFYKSSLLNIIFEKVYVNENKEIVCVKKEIVKLNEPNLLSKEQLISVIKNNLLLKNDLYKIFSIKYFNIDLDEENIEYLVNLDITSNIELNFLHNLSKLDSIKFNDSIKFFHKVNRIYLFYIKDKKNISNLRNQTKKVYLNNSTLKNKNGRTRKHIQL